MSLQGWVPCLSEHALCQSPPGQGTRQRHMELLLAGECSTDEPFVRVGACGQAQYPSSQVSIQVGTQSPPQTAGSHLCSLESSVCIGGRVHRSLE